MLPWEPATDWMWKGYGACRCGGSRWVRDDAPPRGRRLHPEPDARERQNAMVSPRTELKTPSLTPPPPCPECGGRRRIVGFVPDNECAWCRVELFRCDRCDRRSDTTVCSIDPLVE